MSPTRLCTPPPTGTLKAGGAEGGRNVTGKAASLGHWWLRGIWQRGRRSPMSPCGSSPFRERTVKGAAGPTPAPRPRISVPYTRHHCAPRGQTLNSLMSSETRVYLSWAGSSVPQSRRCPGHQPAATSCLCQTLKGLANCPQAPGRRQVCSRRGNRKRSRARCAVTESEGLPGWPPRLQPQTG